MIQKQTATRPKVISKDFTEQTHRINMNMAVHSDSANYERDLDTSDIEPVIIEMTINVVFHFFFFT